MNRFRGTCYIASGWFSPAQKLALDRVEKTVVQVNDILKSMYFMRKLSHYPEETIDSMNNRNLLLPYYPKDPSMMSVNFIKMFSPRLHNPMNQSTGARSTKDRMECFKGDCDKVRECDFMICSAVEYDSGTIFELGMAYQLGKPIIYYNDNPEDHKRIRNLMLVGACDNYYAKDVNDLIQILLTGEPTSYGDDVETEENKLK